MRAVSLLSYLAFLVMLSTSVSWQASILTDSKTVWSDAPTVALDSARAEAYAEVVHMLGALGTFMAEADSFLPSDDPLWYEWEQLPLNMLARRDSLMSVHSSRLSAIVAEHGLPPKHKLDALVEETVVEAARQYPILPNSPMMAWSATYIIWRHSVDESTQRRLLPAIVERQTADYEGRIKYALEMSLVDRVSLRTEKFQMYGTLMCRARDRLRYFPIRDRAFANAYRQKAGMRPLVEHLDHVNRAYPDSGRPCPKWALK